MEQNKKNLSAIKKVLKIGLPLDCVKKKFKSFFHRRTYVFFKSCYMQYSEQARKILSSSDDFFTNSFHNKVKKKSSVKIFLWENEHHFPHTLLQTSIPNFLKLNIYFSQKKTYVFWNSPPWNDVEVSNVLKSKVIAFKQTSDLK